MLLWKCTGRRTEQTTLVRVYLALAIQSPCTVIVLPHRNILQVRWSEGRGAETRRTFDNASLIDSDSLQVLCRFPNLVNDAIYIGKDVSRNTTYAT